MGLTIKTKAGQVRAVIAASSNSVMKHATMGEHELSLSFTLPDFIQLEVDDTVDFEGATFTLMEDYQPTMQSAQKWQYDPKFYGSIADAKRTLVIKTTDGEFSPVFSLTAKPIEHVRLYVENLNRRRGTNLWKVGEVVDGENITIDYNKTFVFDGMTDLAGKAGTEWWADGTTMNLTRCEYGNPVSLGYNQGLKNLFKDENQNAKFFTRLYPIGSTRNIVASDYGHSRLQLPGGVKYVEQNLQFGIIEHAEEDAFSHIYPRRTGTISSVRAVPTVLEGENRIVYYFRDNGLSFDPNSYEIAGLVKHIVFQSGELNGYDFEVNYHSGTREFEIILQYPEGFDQLPGGSLIPKAGDKYILYNIKMPTEYYTLAENEYKEAVDAYMEKNKLDKAVYRGDTDYIEIKTRGLQLKVGQRVRILSSKYFPSTGYRDSRITAISQNVQEPGTMTLSFSDVIAKGKLDTIQSEINEAMNFAQSLGGIPDMIKSWENTLPTDSNLYSALKSVREFLSKRSDDTAEGLLTFLKGAHFGKYTSGILGTGGAIGIDADGNSAAEFDYLTVRKKAVFKDVTVQDVKHIGGELVISPAAMVCSAVEEFLAYYRCYFDSEDGTGLKIFNEFAVGDQARCQTFNLTTQEGGYQGNRYYWRLVVGVGSNYIDLSKSDADVGSDIPRTGDNIAQLGNRTDKTRQNAQVLSAYGSGAPSFKQYQGIDSYSLEGKEDTRISPGDNYFSGAVNIAEGSIGWENLKGLPEEFDNFSVGAINLVRNSGFTGMYESAELEEDSKLEETSELFSPGMEFWTGAAVSQEDEISRSGHACHFAGNTITQNITGLIIDERYILSLKAKGAFRIIFAGIEKTIGADEYTTFFFKTQAFSREHQLSIAGEGLVCEVQIERGTVRSDWNTSPLDNDKTLSEFQAIKYLSDAIKMGSTSIIGGLILSNILKLGNYVDGAMKNVTAGISGVYNDDDDVAFWGGGTHEQAIRTVMKFVDDPTVELSDEEWKSLANAVITHGGRAILNDVIVRGGVYANFGKFTGTVYAKDGEFTGKVNATSGTFKGRVEATEGFFNGKVENTVDGETVVIDPSDSLYKIKLLTALGIVAALSFSTDSNTGRTVGDMGVYDRDAGGTITSQTRMTPGEIYVASRLSGIKTIQFKTTGGNAYAVLENLPTSSAGLDTGQIWRDGSTLKIVT